MTDADLIEALERKIVQLVAEIEAAEALVVWRAIKEGGLAAAAARTNPRTAKPSRFNSLQPIDFMGRIDHIVKL